MALRINKMQGNSVKSEIGYYELSFRERLGSQPMVSDTLRAWWISYCNEAWAGEQSINDSTVRPRPPFNSASSIILYLFLKSTNTCLRTLDSEEPKNKSDS